MDTPPVFLRSVLTLAFFKLLCLLVYFREFTYCLIIAPSVGHSYRQVQRGGNEPSIIVIIGVLTPAKEGDEQFPYAGGHT